jgi:hypothetical protein
MSPLPNNRVLVHELALDHKFRMDITTGETGRWRAQIADAIFGEMRKDMEAGQGEKWIAFVVNSSQKRLCKLLAPGNPLATLIAEALDPAVVARDVANKTFTFDRLFEFMHTIIPRLCAPFRDAEIKRLLADQSGDLIDRIARLMYILDLLSIDYANYVLHLSAPKLIEEAPAYEQRQFAQDLARRSFTLRKTLCWWIAARDKLIAEMSRRDVEGVHLPAHRPTREKIYLTALTDLAISPAATFPEALCPETLHLDYARLFRLRHDTLRITIIGAVLLTAKNLLKRDVRQHWKAEAAKLWDLLAGPAAYSDPQTPSNMLSVVEASHALPGPTKTHLSAAVQRFLAQAKESATATGPVAGDPVTRLLSGRLRSHVLARLSATSAGERVRVASTASEGLAGVGLPEFVARVGSMVEDVRSLGNVDRAAHGRWYEDIEQRAERRDALEAKGKV